MVAYFKANVPWEYYFVNLVPSHTEGIYVVIDSNTCLDQRFTMELDGDTVTYVRLGESHESQFDSMRVAYSFATTGGCHYQVNLYPSIAFEDCYYDDSRRIWYAGMGVAIIAVTAVVF